ncbi:MAG: hypothetical protein M3O61_12135 [Gemmatimonadota bacterium]|nr:hypothetical protein [Gemmatimonadota bacterium]
MVTRAALHTQRGASRLGCLIQLVILGGLLYFGLYAGQDILEYYRLRDAMKQEARFATLRSDTQIRDRIRSFADSVGLPEEASDISIVRGDNTIRIWSEYDQPLRLPFNLEKSIHLKPSVEQRL